MTSTEHIKITTSFSSQHGEVTTVVQNVPADKVSLYVLKTHDEQTRRALMALGWQPPKE